MVSLHGCGFLQFSPIFLKHVYRWIGYVKIDPRCERVIECACEWCPAMEWHPIQCVFLPHIQCSQDRPMHHVYTDSLTPHNNLAQPAT